MYLKISAQFTYADRPENYRGLTSEQWRFGYKKALRLSEMCEALLGEVFTYYLRLGNTEELNTELGKLREWLDGTRFDE